VSLRAPHPTGNYAYVKFDAFIQIFEESFNVNGVSAPLPVIVSSLLLPTTEMCPPLSNPHALHTRLELCNLCVTRFEPS
jgi:hypothetical protein